jgi:predicted site-specific integrase-resolvase
MLHTAHGIATLLCVSERKVNRWADAGLIPCIALPNGERRFDGDAVQQWLRSLERQPLGLMRCVGGISQPR